MNDMTAREMASHSDEALRVFIHMAYDQGQYELAATLALELKARRDRGTKS